jgi:streptogramin lyase
MQRWTVFAVSIFIMSCSGQERTETSENTKLRHVTAGAVQPFIVHVATSDSFHARTPISAIFEDESGIKWIATNGEGAFRYDGERFTRFTVNDGLCSNFVWNVQQDKNGKLWFTTRDGICRYDDTHFTWFTDNGLRRNEPSYVPAPDVDTVYEWKSNRGDIWFNGYAGPYRYDGAAFSYVPLPKSNFDYSKSPSPSNQVSPYGVYCAFEDNDGNVWFGTQSMGVCRFDGKSFTWLVDFDLSGPAVRAIIQDKNGNM